MASTNYLKCPGGDPLSNTMPELFRCVVCNSQIEIWTDEVGGRCPACKTYFKKIQLSKPSTTQQNSLHRHNAKLRQLIEDAQKSGATELAIVSTGCIVVDNDLANRCREPRCENYGLSKSCPPHVSGPSVFRKTLEEFNQAIFFRIDVPSEILYSGERRELFQLLHEIAAGIEKSAVKMGFSGAQAYVGGSCKKIFCYEHRECLALAEKGECRNPGYARPSMSGFGINVARLFETVGWPMGATTKDAASITNEMASVCGLVLVC
jgi:predicted metal-binding protein